MFPTKGISSVQRQQMVSCAAHNVKVVPTYSFHVIVPVSFVCQSHLPSRLLVLRVTLMTASGWSSQCLQNRR